MTKRELQMLQALPLEVKIMKTQARIREWVEHYGLDNVYVSYSGGKDSEVLLDIARKDYPDIKAVFCNTTQEFPETVKQIYKRIGQGYNIDIIKPKKSFKDVVKEAGYPVVSKEQSYYIYQARNTKSEKLRNLRLNGGGNNGKRFKISEKWKYLVEEADFKISDKCCHYLKKEPLYRYNKETGRKAIVGVMASESSNRMKSYMQTGCNSYDQKSPQSKPLGFWKEEDIWEYINTTNLEISECYTIHKMKRQGCYGCLFGCHLEERSTGTNRILELKKTHPKLHKYLMDNLNYKHVMKVLGLRTFEIEQLNLFEEEN